MPLVDANDLFSHARAHKYAVPRLVIRDLDDLQEAFRAAETERAPGLPRHRRGLAGGVPATGGRGARGP